MKTVTEFPYGAVILLLAFMLIVVVSAYIRAQKKLRNEIKDKKDGRVLGNGNIPAQDLDYERCEQPYLGMYKEYN